MSQYSLQLKFNGGLLPVVVQDYKTGKVLMLAWMNAEAWEASLKEKRGIYWSRSRNSLWRKGEKSGNIQIIKSIYVDCDSDSILLKVEQRGRAACHTGHESCFFREVKNNRIIINSTPLFDPSQVYGKHV